MNSLAALRAAVGELPAEQYVVDRPVDERGQYQRRLAAEFPFEINRLRARLGYDINERIGVLAEWLTDSYDEPLLPIADYEADRYGLYLRLRP